MKPYNCYTGKQPIRILQIVQETQPDIGTIWSDPYQLRQVLINLLTNAIHATGSGGRITIIIEALNGEINLTVQDNGQGIPKENLDKIFEPFFSTKSPGKRHGFGAVCYAQHY